MREDGFRFSHDRRFGGVSFGEFLATAKALCETVSSIRNSVDVEVVTAEDERTYHYTTTTFWSNEIEKALKKRRRYSLNKLTQEVWNRSLDVQVSLRDEQDRKPFMICVSCDKYDDYKRIKFYGQGLDEQTRQAVSRKFRRLSLSHSIGDGMKKISSFNMAMGSRLTGIRLPIR